MPQPIPRIAFAVTTAIAAPVAAQQATDALRGRPAVHLEREPRGERAEAVDRRGRDEAADRVEWHVVWKATQREVAGGPLEQRAAREAMIEITRLTVLLDEHIPPVRGSISSVSRDGKLLIVELELGDDQATPGSVFAIHDGTRYKGELLAVTVAGRHVTGRVVRQVADVAKADRVDTRPDREPAAALRLPALVDHTLARLQDLRVHLWQPVAQQAGPVEELRPNRAPKVMPFEVRGERVHLPPKPPTVLQTSLSAVAACQDRLWAAPDAAAARLALDDAEKALMAFRRALGVPRR